MTSIERHGSGGGMTSIEGHGSGGGMTWSGMAPAAA
jgi:hypothetical protein